MSFSFIRSINHDIVAFTKNSTRKHLNYYKYFGITIKAALCHATIFKTTRFQTIML